MGAASTVEPLPEETGEMHAFAANVATVRLTPQLEVLDRVTPMAANHIASTPV